MAPSSESFFPLYSTASSAEIELFNASMRH
jgi:hypothetical protein